MSAYVIANTRILEAGATLMLVDGDPLAGA